VKLPRPIAPQKPTCPQQPGVIGGLQQAFGVPLSRLQPFGKADQQHDGDGANKQQRAGEADDGNTSVGQHPGIVEPTQWRQL
jgi:hypothetical protein